MTPLSLPGASALRHGRNSSLKKSRIIRVAHRSANLVRLHEPRADRMYLLA